MPEPRRAAPQGRDHQAFPSLDADQIDRVRRFGVEETLPAGAVLFERGERTVDFFVAVEGAIEIYDYDCGGEPNVFTVHGESQFTGELDLFNDRKILVAGRMGGDGRVIRVARDRFRDLLTAEPDLGEIITRALILRRLGLLGENIGAAVLLGDRSEPNMLRLRRFLRRNGYPVRTVFTDEPLAAEILAKHDASPADLPLLLVHGEEPLAKPSNLQAAESVGIVEWPATDRTYDVAVIGAGPGGLAAAVYASSEGLDTVILERDAPGGQASTSSRIENYLGFPNGLSGQELAGRAQVQAQKFGATLALPMTVEAIEAIEGREPPYKLRLAEGIEVCARTIVIATGARYRTLEVEGYERYEGRGIHYAATAIEGGLCNDQEVVVVGGGNSAGQAAVFLASQARRVHMLVRGDGLAASMSDYLIRRIEASRAIDLCCGSSITRLAGEDCLREVTWASRTTGGETTKPIAQVFLMIGATPNTGWLGDSIYHDERGFLCTGSELVNDGKWPLARAPEPFETSLPGVFAIGDVRRGSVKRVASGVGEGSVCVQFVHRVLAGLTE